MIYSAWVYHRGEARRTAETWIKNDWYRRAGAGLGSAGRRALRCGAAMSRSQPPPPRRPSPATASASQSAAPAAARATGRWQTGRPRRWGGQRPGRGYAAARAAGLGRSATPERGHPQGTAGREPPAPEPRKMSKERGEGERSRYAPPPATGSGRERVWGAAATRGAGRREKRSV